MSSQGDVAARGLNHVLQADAGTDTALLLIHPLGADLAFWDECVTQWSPVVSTLACDLRSAGQSPRADGPAEIAGHVADLEALCARLGLRRVVPVGCAIGSMIAAAYAASQPGRVPALVLANPALRTTEAAADMLRERAQAVRDGGMAAILPGAVDKPFLNQPLDERRDRYFRRFAGQDAHAYARSVLGIVTADVTTAVDALRCPVLVAAGAHDVLLPPAQARQVHERLAHSRYVQFDSAAHFLPYQQPAAFAQEVLRFLRETGNLN